MNIDYATVKAVHQGSVALSLTGFFVRSTASLAGGTWVRTRLARTATHAVDTLLFVSGLTLAWTLRLTPGEAPWLIAKVAGLVLYVALGVVALRPGQRLGVRVVALVAALTTAGWIVSVAIAKSPLGFIDGIK